MRDILSTLAYNITPVSLMLRGLILEADAMNIFITKKAFNPDLVGKPVLLELKNEIETMFALVAEVDEDEIYFTRADGERINFTIGDAEVHGLKIQVLGVPAAGPELAAAAEPTKREPAVTINRRTTAQINEQTVAIAEFLRGRDTETTAMQIYDHMNLMGYDWRYSSISTLIEVSMTVDPCIKKVDAGKYRYIEGGKQLQIYTIRVNCPECNANYDRQEASNKIKMVVCKDCNSPLHVVERGEGLLTATDFLKKKGR